MEPVPTGSRLADKGGPVVVGHDGRRSGRLAVEWAAAEAVRRGTRLVIIYAADYPGMKDRAPGEALAPGALESAGDVTDEGIELVRELHPALEVSGRTEVTGPADALVAASADAALVVVGTRAFPRLVKAVIGSVAYTVAARSACPVVVVKDDGSRAARTPGPGRPIVVGMDGSAAAEAARRFAAAHALATSARLEVACCRAEDFSATVPESELQAEREALAATIADELARSHPDLEITVDAPDQTPQVVLVERSAETGLVVVGSAGRSALGGLVLGSVSQAVIHGSVAPVAVIGPPALTDPQVRTPEADRHRRAGR